MTDKDLVIDRHALAHEALRGNLAPRADKRVLLNLDERANLGFVIDTAAIEVHERWLRDADVVPELDVA